MSNDIIDSVQACEQAKLPEKGFDRYFVFVSYINRTLLRPQFQLNDKETKVIASFLDELINNKVGQWK